MKNFWLKQRPSNILIYGTLVYAGVYLFLCLIQPVIFPEDTESILILTWPFILGFGIISAFLLRLTDCLLTLTFSLRHIFSLKSFSYAAVAVTFLVSTTAYAILIDLPTLIKNAYGYEELVFFAYLVLYLMILFSWVFIIFVGTKIAHLRDK